MEDYFKVGVITSPHGVRGEVKVYPTTDDPNRFRDLKKVFLDDRGGDEREVGGVKFVKNLVVLKLSGISSMDEAERYRQRELFVRRADAVPLEENEFFIADLIGCEVRTEEGQVLGTLTDVLQTGANDVYVVEFPAGGEVLIPAIRDCIRRVDVDAGVVTVHLLPGLMPEKKEES